MTVDTDLALALHERLSEVIDNSKATLVGGLEFKEYQQACGMIEAYKQVRDALIPELLDTIQKR